MYISKKNKKVKKYPIANLGENNENTWIVFFADLVRIKNFRVLHPYANTLSVLTTNCYDYLNLQRNHCIVSLGLAEKGMFAFTVRTCVSFQSVKKKCIQKYFQDRY